MNGWRISSWLYSRSAADAGGWRRAASFPNPARRHRGPVLGGDGRRGPNGVDRIGDGPDARGLHAGLAPEHGAAFVPGHHRGGSRSRIVHDRSVVDIVLEHQHDFHHPVDRDLGAGQLGDNGIGPDLYRVDGGPRRWRQWRGWRKRRWRGRRRRGIGFGRSASDDRCGIRRAGAHRPGARAHAGWCGVSPVGSAPWC